MVAPLAEPPALGRVRRRCPAPIRQARGGAVVALPTNRTGERRVASMAGTRLRKHHRPALAEDARKLRRALTYNGLTLVRNEGEILKLSFSATAAGDGAAASQDDPGQKRKDQCADAHGDRT